MLKQRAFEGTISVREGLHLHEAEVTFDGESWNGQRNERYMTTRPDIVIAKLLLDHKWHPKWKSGGRFRITVEPIE